MKYTNKTFSIPFSYAAEKYFRTFPHKAVNHMFFSRHEGGEIAYVIGYDEATDTFSFIVPSVRVDYDESTDSFSHTVEEGATKQIATVDEFFKSYM